MKVETNSQDEIWLNPKSCKTMGNQQPSLNILLRKVQRLERELVHYKSIMVVEMVKVLI